MTNLGNDLREGDPLAEAPALGPEEAQRIRRAILAAVGQPTPTWRPRPVMIGATIAGTLVAGVVLGRRLPHEEVRPGRSAIAGETPRAAEPATRQVQFDTPGGTRIIWVIDPDFDL